MIRYGGNMTVWVTECERMVDERLLGFRPDVIWCTFGRMESALLARSLARRFGCPWVLDLKDNWDLYVPRGLRRLMAWRTRGWSRVTANARFTAEKARRWQRTEADIVYSGVEDAFFSQLAGADASDRLTVNVVGSVYSDVRLRALLHGIGLWAESLDDARRARVLVCYMGPDARRFADVSRDLARIVAVGVEGYVGVERMAAACRSAVANTYVKHDGTFHHKLLELLSCGVPVVVVPSESEESRGLARAVGGALHECPDAAVVADTIGALSRRPRPPAQLPVAGPAGAEYSWTSQSVRLRAVLRSVVHMNEEAAS
jgi:glycosyltransferase involved in cell wall biosynthesis